MTMLSCFGRSYVDIKGTETVVYWETAYGYSVHRMHTQYFNDKRRSSIIRNVIGTTITIMRL